MRRLILFLVGFSVPVIFWLVFVHDWRRAPSEPPARPVVLPVEPEPVPAEPIAPAPRRALLVTGLLLGPDREPLPGLRVALAEEVAAVTDDGSFVFPARVRARATILRVLEAVGERELARWPGVIVGDLGDPEDEPSEDRGAGDVATDVPEEALDGLEDAATGDLGVDAAEPDAAPDSPGAAADLAVSGADLDALEARPFAPMEIPERVESIRLTINLGRGVSGHESDSPAVESSPPEEEPGDVRFEVGHVLVEEWGRSARIRVRGTSKLPDGATINGSLYFVGFRFLSSLDPAPVRDRKFEAVIPCPPEVELYSGVYTARVSFDLLLQTPDFRRRLSGDPSIPDELVTGRTAEREIFIGDPAEARAEDLEAEAYYAGIADAVRGYHRNLESRMEEIRTFGPDTAPWVLENREAAREGWFHEPLVEAESGFREDLWRRFLDVEWRPAVRGLRERHEAREQEKYQEAAEHAQRALRALEVLSFVYSRFIVYPLMRLPPHPNDFFLDEDREGDRFRLERTLRQSTEELERYRHIASRGGSLAPARDE